MHRYYCLELNTLCSVAANIFEETLPDTFAKRSTSVVLNCDAYGYPNPSVLWESSGRDISDRSKYQQLQNGSLRILQLEKADAGKYTCTASNTLGKKTVTRELKVQGD